MTTGERGVGWSRNRTGQPPVQAASTAQRAYAIRPYIGTLRCMTYDPELHHRRSIRLAGRDYAAVGSYFVTICTYSRELLFGEIIDGCVRLNPLGTIVAQEWVKTRRVRPNVEIDAWVVMPNHLHGIIVIRDAQRGHQPDGASPFQSPSQTIGAIVRGVKAAVTRQVNDMRDTPGVTVWQRNYHEHIVRDQRELDRIRDYIATNPLRWGNDTLNPLNGPML